MILPTHIVAAGGVILNEKNEILLVKNPRKGWEFPGGIVEEGETVPQGLMREIKEETGVNVAILNLIGIYSNTRKKKGYNGVKEVPTTVSIDFLCKYLSGELIASEESLEVKWFSRDEAIELVNPRQKYRFLKALDYKAGINISGFFINSEEKFEVHEEYQFER